MTLPNFFLIGAMKCGTTSIYEWLKQHPEVYMSPRKEPNYFANDGKDFVLRPGVRKNVYPTIKSIEDYCALFRDVDKETAIGEATVRYLFNPRTPERIRKFLPDAKLIVILRDPVDRAFSHYWMRVVQGDEPIPNFMKALNEEEHRLSNGWDPFSWSYKGVSLYYAQLKRYFDLFDQDHIRVYLYEDFKSEPVGLMQDMFRFLRVDDCFIPDVNLKYHVSEFNTVPKNKVMHVLLTKPNPIRFAYRSVSKLSGTEKRFDHLKRRLISWKIGFSSIARRQLREGFRDDILKLQHLIQRDLSHWLE